MIDAQRSETRCEREEKHKVFAVILTVLLSIQSQIKERKQFPNKKQGKIE